MPSSIAQAIEPLIQASIGATALAGVLRTLPPTVMQPVGSLNVVEVRDLLSQLQVSTRLFAAPGKAPAPNKLRTAITGTGTPAPCEQRHPVSSDRDVVHLQRATQAMTRGFFSGTDVVRLVTAVSELARNIYMYAGEGAVTLLLGEEAASYVFRIDAEDEGPGIPNLDVILSGGYRSRTGLGRGIIGTKALLDDLQIRSQPGSTRISGLRRARKQ